MQLNLTKLEVAAVDSHTNMETVLPLQITAKNAETGFVKVSE